MAVLISPNIKRQSVRIDPAGNIINARTKQVIEPVTPEYVAPVPENIPSVAFEENPNRPYTAPQAPTANGISVIEQIRQAKENLAQLEELKKLQIAAKKAELELLES